VGALPPCPAAAAAPLTCPRPRPPRCSPATLSCCRCRPPDLPPPPPSTLQISHEDLVPSIRAQSRTMVTNNTSSFRGVTRHAKGK